MTGDRFAVVKYPKLKSPIIIILNSMNYFYSESTRFLQTDSTETHSVSQTFAFIEYMYICRINIHLLVKIFVGLSY